MTNAMLARSGLMIALAITGLPAMAQSILLDPATATYGNPLRAAGAMSTSSVARSKTLVTPKALPAEGDFERLGQIDVQSDWFGSTNKATRLLAEKARNMGGNAVVESRVWQALSFPAIVVPHGSGIVVRIKDRELLESLTDSASTWE